MPRMSAPVAPGANLKATISTNGADALAEPLARALRAQWAYGFPIVPKPGLQLTHGFLHYPAGMQALAATHLLDVLPDGLLLDPFVGGGTTLVEAIRTGRQVIGADVSPLALFTSAHHTWYASDLQLDVLREQATSALRSVDPTFAPMAGNCDVTEASPSSEAEVQNTQAPAVKLERSRKLDGGRSKGTTYRDWEPLKAEVEKLAAAQGEAPWPADGANGDAAGETAAPGLSPLWFCYAAAQQRAERYRYLDPLATYDSTVDLYCNALRQLRKAAPSEALESLGSGGAARLLHCDARELSLSSLRLPLADAVLTSPPYAGVYDYLSHARESRARLGAQGEAPLMGLQGTPEGRDWPENWRSSHEMGARKAMKKARAPGQFKATWSADQRAWLAAMRENLRPGGRAALLVGDGDSEIDALESTAAAAEDVGLTFLASATIQSIAKRGERQKGKRRPEHVLLLEVPST